MLKITAVACVLLFAAVACTEAKNLVLGVKWDAATKPQKKIVNDYARQWRRCLNYGDLEAFVRSDSWIVWKLGEGEREGRWEGRWERHH